jgi:hypothetical protein
MKAKLLGVCSAAIFVCCMGVSAARQPQKAPEDIPGLANMAEMNRPYFNSMIVGIVRFSGVGEVKKNGGRPDPMLVVDMGSHGAVNCMSSNGQQKGLPAPSLKPGDRVRVSGSIGNADSGEAISEITDKPEKDTIMLTTASCSAKKVSQHHHHSKKRKARHVHHS